MDRLPVLSVGRIGRRERAALLEQRMLVFSAIYNAAALVRNSWHGREERRRQCADKMAEAVLAALQGTEDREAALYAIADALHCSPLGVPWEA